MCLFSYCAVVAASRSVVFSLCIRRLLSQADSSFALAHVPPVAYRWPASSFGLSKLLRRIPVKFIPNIDPDDCAAMDALLAQMDSLQLYELDTTEAILPVHDCVRLLDHPAMHSLQVLVLGGSQAMGFHAVFEAIARLPKIHSLRMIHAGLSPSSPRFGCCLPVRA